MHIFPVEVPNFRLNISELETVAGGMMFLLNHLESMEGTEIFPNSIGEDDVIKTILEICAFRNLTKEEQKMKKE